jgi:NADH-quinone oxidoreductase subunit J
VTATVHAVTTLAAESKTSTGEAVAFWILGPLAVLAALGMVSVRRAVHSALFLAWVMITLAIFYIIQDALFLGVVQIIVYTGAIMMLFLFVVMIVGVDSSDSLIETIRGQRFAAVAVGLGFGFLLIAVIGNASVSGMSGLATANQNGNVQGLAALMFTKYVWAFEVTSALLITAAVGGMVLAHRERMERKRTQRELAEERLKGGGLVTQLPPPGVYARHNAVDTPALLPDGTPAELSVSRVLQARGDVRTVAAAKGIIEAPVIEDEREVHDSSQLGKGSTP